MAPTLQSNPGGWPDVVLLDRLTPRLRAPRRGEVVLFSDSEGWIMKRVVAMPGERVAIRRGRVLIDGKPLASPDSIARVSYVCDGYLASGKGLLVLPENFVVLGDHSLDSYDSRYWGGLPKNKIAGIARAVIWPSSRFSIL